MHPIHIVTLKMVYDITPAFGHLGYGGMLGGSYFHYIHHTKKDWNFGGTPLFDSFFGSHLPKSKSDDNEKLE